MQWGNPNCTSRSFFWVDFILGHQHADGWLGPKEDPHVGSGETSLDPWPMFVVFKALIQWQEATSDARIVPALERALRCIAVHLETTPLDSWAKMRWPDLVFSILWLYRPFRRFRAA